MKCRELSENAPVLRQCAQRQVINTEEGVMRYTWIDERVLLDLDQRQFGLYSLRLGSASAAACASISDRLLKCHGTGAVRNVHGCD